MDRSRIGQHIKGTYPSFNSLAKILRVTKFGVVQKGSYDFSNTYKISANGLKNIKDIPKCSPFRPLNVQLSKLCSEKILWKTTGKKRNGCIFSEFGHQ